MSHEYFVNDNIPKISKKYNNLFHREPLNRKNCCTNFCCFLLFFVVFCLFFGAKLEFLLQHLVKSNELIILIYFIFIMS